MGIFHDPPFLDHNRVNYVGFAGSRRSMQVWAGPINGPVPYSAPRLRGKARPAALLQSAKAEDRPIVIVFARSLSEPVGQLAKQLDNAVKEHKTAELRAWVTFLAEDQTSLDPKVVQWAQKHAVSNVPCAVFEDTVGPPAYRRRGRRDGAARGQEKGRRELCVSRGELNEAAIRDIVKTMPKIVGAK